MEDLLRSYDLVWGSAKLVDSAIWQNQSNHGWLMLTYWEMKQCWTDGGLPLASIAMFALWLKTGGPSSKAQARTGWRDGARLCLPESWGWRWGQQHFISYLRYPTQITQIFCNPRVYTCLVLASLRNRNRTARCDLKSSRYSATNSHSVALSSDFLVQDMGRRRPIIWAMTVARGTCSFPGTKRHSLLDSWT